MKRDPKCFLWDIQQSSEAILEFLTDRIFEDYEQQRMLRSAVEREFVLIGEATNRLATHAPQIASRITDYQKIISLRNIIAHEYDDVRNDLVWTVVNDGLPTLLSEVTALLAQP